ncbi:MAG: hypothetical protein KBT11_04255 [Treponema sp.]|nr:hypothetical protein [Candidatus Treponema equifaecale]
MECKDYVEIGLSILALIGSTISFFYTRHISKKQLNFDKKQTDLNYAQTEIEIRNMISQRKQYFQDILVEFAKTEPEKLYKAALEDVLNAYDEACMKYIDEKIDKERFKKNYLNEIKNLVETNETKDNFFVKPAKFQAIEKVYNEWFSVE